MKPKDKAIELVDRMFDVDLKDEEQQTSMKYSHAKQCALIAVDEIINLYDAEEKMGEAFIEYWQEVKQEIEKL